MPQMTKTPLSVYFKPDVKARVEAAAEECGVSASAFIRMTVLERLRREELPEGQRQEA